LTLVTDSRTSGCWGGESPQFIDHIVPSKDAAPWLAPQSFAQLDYDASDAAFKTTLRRLTRRKASDSLLQRLKR
jgi:hypothetical protein